VKTFQSDLSGYELLGTPHPLILALTPSDCGVWRTPSGTNRDWKVYPKLENLATETDSDAISVAIAMFWWQVWSQVYRPMPTSPNASFTQKFQDGGRIPGAVILLCDGKRYQGDLSGCSNVLGHA